MLNTIRAKSGATAAAAASGYYASSIYRNIVANVGVQLPSGPVVTPVLFGMMGFYVYDNFVEGNKSSGAELMLGGAVGYGANYLARRR